MEKEFRVSTKKNVKVIIDDKEYSVRLPAVKDQVKLSEMTSGLDETSPQQTEALIDWLDTLGLPRDVTMSMYQVDLSKFIEDYLLESKKK